MIDVRSDGLSWAAVLYLYIDWHVDLEVYVFTKSHCVGGKTPFATEV